MNENERVEGEAVVGLQKHPQDEIEVDDLADPADEALQPERSTGRAYLGLNLSKIFMNDKVIERATSPKMA